MRRARYTIQLCCLACLSFAGTGERSLAVEETVRFGRAGTVSLYHPASGFSEVVLFVSGDGGWNKGVVDMAKELSTLDTLVVGIDITRLLRNLDASSEDCAYPAADLETLGQFVQKKLGRPRYVRPVLCGYSSGATLVYAALAQAPPGTFKGAISLGFCPDLALSKPLCRGHGLVSARGPRGKGFLLAPAASLETPWIVLQGKVDQVCDLAATEKYVKQIGRAEVVTLPGVGHGFSRPGSWVPQFRQSFARLVQEIGSGAGAGSTKPGEDGGALKDLPLVEVQPKGDRRDTLAVLVSGDGGWAGLDREVAGILAGKGLPVIGLNSLQYFWTRRTPDGSARDLERILRHYLSVFRSEKVLLIGYSRGADVLPFMANRLPADLLSRVRLVTLIGPAHSVDFEFHLSDWLGGGARETALPVLPEVRKLSGVKLVCFYGENESDSLCPDLALGPGKIVRLSGGHHFGGNYADIADRILLEAGPEPAF